MFVRQFGETNYRISLAHQHAPKDVLTKGTGAAVKATTSLLPVQLVTTAFGGRLIAATFGIISLILTLIWLPLFVFLVGTSWLWLKVWILRPLLMIPGVLIALFTYVFVSLMPEPESDVKRTKLTFAGEWPLSWYLMKPPSEH